MTEENEVVTERPEWLPEKFKDEQAFVASYKELEQKQSSTPPAEIQPKAEPAIEETTQFNINDYYKEYADSGALSEGSYETLKANGWDQAQVDRVIQLETDAAAKEAQAIYDTIEGGADAYNNATAWAQDNLDDSYKEAFNTSLNSPILRDNMIKDLMGKWKEAGGEVAVDQGSNVDGIPSAGGPQVDSFTTQGEMLAVMASPEYKRDPEFRKKMEAKALRSKF